MKEKNFGFRTPIRRSTKNISGNKVWWELTGWECKIIKSNFIKTNDSSYNFTLNFEDSIKAFDNNYTIIAIWWYFLCNKNCKIKFHIKIDNEIYDKIYNIEWNKLYSLWFDHRVNLDTKINEIEVWVSFYGENLTINYTWLSYWFVNKENFINIEWFSEPYFNSKREICFPEQFYFDNEIILDESESNWAIFILKSCNRCQRFLPINNINQRDSISFSNHCAAKAPCKHANFSNYKILENDLSINELKNFIDKECDENLSLEGDYIRAYYGHQLECKACKKFFVNHALNPLRTSTQHREDWLRRRAIERLIGELLKKEWIYHSFRLKEKKEFDLHIWEKFNKKCFNCEKELSSTNEMHLDHTMPLSYLYPLNETATCLCDTCNSSKSDIFPIDFYKTNKLIELSEKTNIPIEILSSRKSNDLVVNKLKSNLLWFFDIFLQHKDYLKVREWKRACDSIYHSVQKAIKNNDPNFNLKDEYNKLKKEL